jgi:hypothetical protein
MSPACKIHDLNNASCRPGQPGAHHGTAVGSLHVLSPTNSHRPHARFDAPRVHRPLNAPCMHSTCSPGQPWAHHLGAVVNLHILAPPTAAACIHTVDAARVCCHCCNSASSHHCTAGLANPGPIMSELCTIHLSICLTALHQPTI